MRCLALTLALAALPAMATEYPLWEGEPIEEYAKRAGLETTKTLDLGDGVTMEFVLIPAGKFVMGTPEPERVDELYSSTQIRIGQTATVISIGVLLAMLAFVMGRAIREKHQPHVSLTRLLVLALAAGVGVLGGLHWWHSWQAFVEAREEYEKAVVRYESAYSNEKPAHEVTISRPFYMGKYEVTQDQYQQVMGKNPSFFKGQGDLPVETVRWTDAQEFCKRVASRAGTEVRLPREAEWEYACRGGTRTIYYSGDEDGSLNQVGWYRGNSQLKTHPVGQKEANVFGLYDMHGNIWEWCEDAWHYKYEREGQPVQFRAVRGGGWNAHTKGCRSATRSAHRPSSTDPSNGFRVLATVTEQQSAPPMEEK